MNRILVMDFWDASPHMETSLAITKVLDDESFCVNYIFVGRSTVFEEQLSFTRENPIKVIEMYLQSTNVKKIVNPLLPPYDLSENTHIPTNINQLLHWNIDGLELGRACYSAIPELNTCAIPDLKSANIQSKLKTAATSYLQVFQYVFRIIR